MILVEVNHGVSMFSNHVKLIFILLLIYMQQNNMISDSSTGWDQYVIIDIENNINNNVLPIINTLPSFKNHFGNSIFNTEYSYCSLFELENYEYDMMSTPTNNKFSQFINMVLYLYKVITD